MLMLNTQLTVSKLIFNKTITKIFRLLLLVFLYMIVLNFKSNVVGILMFRKKEKTKKMFNVLNKFVDVLF